MAGVVHISEEEAGKDFGALMKHIRSGDEVRLDCKDGVKAIVKIADSDEPLRARNIAEIIEGLTERKERQRLATLDADFEAEARSVRQSQPAFQSRTIVEAIEILRLREQTQGLAVPDPDMASDMEEIHALYNQPMDMSRWD